MKYNNFTVLRNDARVYSSPHTIQHLVAKKRCYKQLNSRNNITHAQHKAKYRRLLSTMNPQQS